MVDQCLISDAPRDCIFDAANACMDSDPQTTQTTFGMMTCHLEARDVWDLHLNAEYTAAQQFAAEMDAADESFFPEYAVRQEQLLAA